MSEAARLLRLVAPGALFLLVYGVWFFLDSQLCMRTLPGIDAGTAALVAGATIPIGFVAQVTAAEITWLPGLRDRCWRPLRTINNRGISVRHRGLKEHRPRVDLVGIVDVWIHEAYQREEHPHALDRLRSVADLYQGLAHGAAASFLAALSAGTTILVTWFWLGDDSVLGDRGLLLFGHWAVCGFLIWGLCASHQRVVRIAEAMVDEILVLRARSK